MQRTNLQLSHQQSPVSSVAPLDAEKREAVVKALDNLKADNIVVIDLTQKASFADVMVIASGTSSRHVASLADSAAKTLTATGHRLLGIEGKGRGPNHTGAGEWVCLDGGDIVIHLFTPGAREHYRLEKLWSFPSPL